VKGLSFVDEAATANALVPELQRQGVSAIVLLLHQGGMQSLGGTYDGCQGFSGDLVPILDRLSPAIDVVVSGHTHQAYNCVLAGRLVTSAMSYGRLITKIDLTIDPSAGRVVDKHARNVPVTRNVAPDAEVSRIVQASEERAHVVTSHVRADRQRRFISPHLAGQRVVLARGEHPKRLCQGVDVGGRPSGGAGGVEHLGSNEVDGAELLTLARQGRFAVNVDQPEVSDGTSTAEDKEVLRLDVPVRHTALVHGGQGAGNLAAEPDELGETICGRGYFLQRLSQRHDQPRRVRIGGGARNTVVKQRNDATNVGAAFHPKDLALETSVRLLVAP
jgi:hypothetical protein